MSIDPQKLREMTAAMTERMTQRASERFEEWMNTPMVRLVISTIPPGDTPDALKTLLRSAFDAGSSCGEASVLSEIVSGIVGKK